MISKEQKYQTSLVVLSLLFLIVYNFTNLTVWWPEWMRLEHLIFNWPDANANYFFAKVFSQSGQLFYFDPLNILTQNLLHSRSINIVGGTMVPIGFLPPIIIFGLMMKVLGSFGILIVTPLLAMFSAWLVYRLVLYVFSDIDLAFITTLLFLSLAPWVFFANTVMLATVMFVFLVLSGWWAIVKSFQAAHNLWWILGSLLLSLAVVVRPTEIVWLALISLAVLYFKRQVFNLRRVIWSIFIFSAVFLIFLSFNKVTYGGYLTLGYFDFESNQVAAGIKSNNPLRLLFAPFGFDWYLLAKNFYKYYIDIILPQVILALAGGVLILHGFKKSPKVWRRYIILSVFIFILILLYYGSWDIADPLVKNLNRISISYVRYFMPLYIWILPLTAYAIKKLFMGDSRSNMIASYLIVIILMTASIKLAFMSENDGLLKNRETLVGYYEQYRQVHELAPEGSVIISQRSDKIFFPVYRVVVPQGDLPLWPRVRPVLGQLKVYYYSNASDEEIATVRQEANQVGLDLALTSQIWEDFILYKVVEK